MAATAVVVNKGLQIILSREDAVNFAQTGKVSIPVRDTAREKFGVITVYATAMTRAAILEHMDFSVPQPLLADALAEKTSAVKGGA